MLRFQFLVKMKIAVVILYSLVATNLLTLKTSAYLMQQLNASYCIYVCVCVCVCLSSSVIPFYYSFIFIVCAFERYKLSRIEKK